MNDNGESLIIHHLISFDAFEKASTTLVMFKHKKRLDCEHFLCLQLLYIV